MTSNPHPEHGPVWSSRDHEGVLSLWVDGLRLKSVSRQADAIEAQINPLPDGVYRRGDEFRLASMFPVADGWTRVAALERRRDAMAITTIIRRVPAEPPAPPTEDVPLHELCGWKLPGALWVVQSVRIAGRHIYAFDTLNPFEATISHPVTLNPDGTVTVQAQGVES